MIEKPFFDTTGWGRSLVSSQGRLPFPVAQVFNLRRRRSRLPCPCSAGALVASGDLSPALDLRGEP